LKADNNKMADLNTFVMLTDDDIADLVDGTDAANTKKQIKFAVQRLETFSKFAGVDLNLIDDDAQLDKLLSRFYAGLRKNDGTLYTKKSMHAIRYGLHRHFLKKDVDITKVENFKESSRVYKSMMVKLKQAGKGCVQHKSPISEEDMAKIFASHLLDIATPEGLQNKVFFDVILYFANRGRENLRSMTACDFDVKVDEQNRRYIVRHDNLTKCRRGNDDETFSGHIYEIPGSSRCPVTSFLAFKDVLNPGKECMWQRPKPIAPTDGSPWYMNSPMGGR
jgi:hypothetical protein